MLDIPNDLKEASEYADYIRIKYWGNSIPVDPVAIAKKMNAKVYLVTFKSDEVSGAVGKKPNEDFEILVKKDDTFYRRRFTVAHELGHIADNLRSDAPYSELSVIDLRDGDSSLGNKEKEIFANDFGASLLMPSEIFANEYKKNSNISFLADLFKVSYSAIKNRIKRLKLNNE